MRMFTTAQDWLERFKEVGGSGRYNTEIVWPDEWVHHRHLAKLILLEISGPENTKKNREVVAHLNKMKPAMSAWQRF